MTMYNLGTVINILDALFTAFAVLVKFQVNIDSNAQVFLWCVAHQSYAIHLVFQLRMVIA